MNLLNEINSIDRIMKSVLIELDKINDDNFQDSIDSIKLKIGELEKTRAYLKEIYPENLLKSNSDLIHTTTKLIVSKFDYIIEKKKEEQNKISEDLKDLTNKKKLIKYQR